MCAFLRLLLLYYIKVPSAHVWAPVTDYPPIPWEDLGRNPSAYYDTVKFSLPLKLALPQTLNTLHTTIWAEHLVRTSSAFADTPFVFYSKERLMGVNGPLATPVQANGDSIGSLFSLGKLIFRALSCFEYQHLPLTTQKSLTKKVGFICLVQFNFLMTFIAAATVVSPFAPQPGNQINQNYLTEGKSDGSVVLFF